MKVFKRGGMIVALAVAAAALFAATATATIAPNPYNSSSASGVFTAISIIGQGSCDLSGVTVSASGTTGTVTGLTASSCRGTISAAGYNKPIGLIADLANGEVRVAVALLIVNNLGGNCLYIGTMVGAPNSTDTITVANTVALVTTLSGICALTTSAELTLSLPGATIS